MAETHLLSGLHNKRAELAGLVDHYRILLKKHEVALSHIDATITIFDEDYTPSQGKKRKYRRNNVFFHSGEGKKVCLDILREADNPMSNFEIYDAIADCQKIDIDSADMKKSFQSSVITILKRLERDEIIEIVKREGSTNYWQIAS